MAALIKKKITYRYYINLLLYAVGFLSSAYLIDLTSGGDSSVCKLFGSDCVEVITSTYGYFLGFSVSSYALAYFAFQILYLLLTRVLGAVTGKKVIVLPISLNIVALAFSIHFLYLQTYRISGFCLFCLLVHAVNASSLLVNFAILRSQKSKYFYTSSHAANINNLAIIFMPLLFGISVFFAFNYHYASKQLAAERLKTTENLEWIVFKYQQAEKIPFDIKDQDTVIGEPGIAIHQIVLIYKDGCSHCDNAKKILTQAVASYDTAVYLVLKDYNSYTENQLTEIGVEDVPAVFVNGKRAEGWELPGFMDMFTKDCGC